MKKGSSINRIFGGLQTDSVTEFKQMGDSVRLLLFTYLIFLTFFVKSQNLVPNGSFETPPVNYSSIGFSSILNNCFLSAGATAPDNWVINSPDPDRMKNGTIYCLRDNDIAQDGSYYAVLMDNEDIEVTLSSPLIKDCLYQFSCYLNLETLRGTQNNPSRVMFFFYAPDGNTIQSPVISWNVWQYFATPFVALDNSTKLEVKNWVAFAGTDIDNIRVELLGCPPLPVTWLYVRSRQNIIEWATASEINSDRFEIISSEGIRTATIKASGNTTQTSYYSINVPDGYYVIKQIDIDGKYSYSGIIRVNGNNHVYEYSNVFKFYTLLGQQR